MHLLKISNKKKKFSNFVPYIVTHITNFLKNCNIILGLYRRPLVWLVYQNIIPLGSSAYCTKIKTNKQKKNL